MATIDTLAFDCRLANASKVAYQIQPHPPSLPESAAYQAARIHTVDGVYDRGTRLIDGGYVARTTDGWVLIGIRGTLPPSFKGPVSDWLRWIDDWLQDFDIGPRLWHVGYKPGTPAGHPPNRTSYGSVEGGFAEAVLDLWDPHDGTTGIRGTLETLAASGALASAKGVLVTGHSKGAAAAPLVASLVRGSYPLVPIHTVGFAMPLTVDATFKACYDGAGLGATTLRYQNEYDVVPLLPWYPSVSLRDAVARSEGVSEMPDWRLSIHNDYVPLGSSRFLTTTCTIEPDVSLHEAAHRLRELVWHDGLHLGETLGTIADAHSLTHNAAASYPTGRYTTCICSPTFERPLRPMPDATAEP